MSMSRFIHLHVHSHYSLLDSTVKLNDLLRAAKDDGMNAVAVTDHSRMFGALEFQNLSKRHGVKPIHGVAIQVPSVLDDPPTPKPDYQLVLIAENSTGYKNLLQIVSGAWLDDAQRYYGSEKKLPRATWETIRNHSEGLICLTGDLGGEIPTWILRRDIEHAEKAARALEEIFGNGNVFLELQRLPGLPEQEDVCEELIQMSVRLNIPVVATNNVHYLEKDGYIAHGVLTSIGIEKRVSPEILELLPIKDLYFKTQEEMEELFEDVPEALSNTVRIAERCDVIIPTGTYFLPDFEVPDGETIDSYMHDRAMAGLEDRFKELELGGQSYDRDVYIDRLEMECEVISRMGYAGYFLIVWDFIAWARTQNIPVGPGRGSGAGSIVAWTLGITDINPIQYGLLFERFLNPERVSMPDFDIDFCQTRRGEVIQYVSDKYGRKNVGMIVTFGQLKAKAVVRDVARVLNFEMQDTNRIAAMIPADPASRDTLADYAEKLPELKQAFAKDAQHELLYDLCVKLEGNVRNTGIHAAGVVIAGSELWNFVPVIVGDNDELITQFAKDEVEQAGLVKFDFLGLKNLTVIQDALDMIERATGERVDFRKVDLNDPATYVNIQRGDTAGIFQMESEGFQRLVRRLRPDVFEDLIAVVALYRPGPLGSGMVDTYIECKHGRREPDYLHPLLEDVLKETFGVMVYQEQVMQAAQILAGYSLGGADLLRRAMGKKLPEEMAKQREMFVEGARANNVSDEKSKEIFDLIVHFAGYGFNKSHSAAYAMISFQTAYLKAHYPAAFYAALMTSDSGRADKISLFISDARARGIKVLPPDINESDSGFTINHGEIRFGLGAIKGLGEGAIQEIVEERERAPFTSLFDFCERVSSSKKQIEYLVHAGAFDSLYLQSEDEEPSLIEVCKIRGRLYASVDRGVAIGIQRRRDRESGQSSLLDMFGGGGGGGDTAESIDEELVDAPPMADSELLRQEKDLLSVYVTGHPFTRYIVESRLYADHTTISAVQNADGRGFGGPSVTIAGMIDGFDSRTLKSGNGKIAMFRLEDHMGEIGARIFSKNYEEIVEQLVFDEPVLVTGRVRVDNRGEEPEYMLVVDSVRALTSARHEAVNRVCCTVEHTQVDAVGMRKLLEITDEFPGRCRLEMQVIFDQATVDIAFPVPVYVDSSDAFIRAMEAILGEGRIRLAS